MTEKTEIVKHSSELPQSINLIQLAIEKGSDIQALEKLMDLQERWERNQATKSFFGALCNFQAEVPKIEKKKTVSFNQTNYKYAELGEIAETIKIALRDNGLSYRWELQENTNQISCTCIISHKDGHAEKTTMNAASDTSGSKNAIQARGSAISYMQRYTLIGALGLTTANEDVDGQTEPLPSKQSSQKVGKPTPPQQAKGQPDYAGGLMKAKTLGELATAWNKIPSTFKPSLETMKNSRKDELRNPQAGTVAMATDQQIIAIEGFYDLLEPDAVKEWQAAILNNTLTFEEAEMAIKKLKELEK